MRFLLARAIEFLFLDHWDGFWARRLVRDNERRFGPGGTGAAREAL